MLFAAYLAVGLPHLGKFQTADEDLWFANPEEGRIHEYWNAFRYKTWEDTRINDKPGVTTAIFGGLFGNEFDAIPEKKVIENGNIVDRFNAEYFEEASFFYRLGIFLVSGLLVLFTAWFLWAATRDRLIVGLSAAFLFLSPVLVGVSQIVNPDATLWSFGIAALTGYFAFLVRGKWYFLFLAGIFFGFALLSKYTGAFLFFVTYFLTFASALYLGTQKEDRKAFLRFWSRRLLGYPVFGILAIVTFALGMPAAILEPEYLYEGTFGFKGAEDVDGLLVIMSWAWGAFLIEAVVLRSVVSFRLIRKLQFLKIPIVLLAGMVLLAGAGFTWYNWGLDNILDLETAPFDAGKEEEYRDIESDGNKLALQIKPLVFTLTPIVLAFSLLAFFLPAVSLVRKRFFGESRNVLALLLAGIGVFVIGFFYAALEQNVLVHVRYSILLYPALGIAAAIFGAFLVRFLKAKNIWLGISAIVLILGASVASLAADRPFYFNYTNDLLPRDQDVVGAWGYGGYEAAQHLNNVTKFPEYLTAWADYEGFCPFFKGRCIKGSIVKWYRGGSMEGIQYFVVSRRGLIRNQSTLEKLVEKGVIDQTPIWTLYIGGRPGNFVEIYQSRGLTPLEE